MRTDTVPFVSAIQGAFMAALEDTLLGPSPAPKVANKVFRALDRAKPLKVRSWDAKLSFRTAQKLKQQGIIE